MTYPADVFVVVKWIIACLVTRCQSCIVSIDRSRSILINDSMSNLLLIDPFIAAPSPR